MKNVTLVTFVNPNASLDSALAQKFKIFSKKKKTTKKPKQPELVVLLIKRKLLMLGSEIIIKLFNQMVQFKMFSRYRDIKQERNKLDLTMK